MKNKNIEELVNLLTGLPTTPSHRGIQAAIGLMVVGWLDFYYYVNNPLNGLPEDSDLVSESSRLGISILRAINNLHDGVTSDLAKAIVDTLHSERS